jgi:hypothetical protein
MENKIHLTFPCTQNWDGMKSLGNDKRHCATCNKCVTNFTNHSTGDALNAINSEGGKTCGMFSVDQLDNIYQRHTLSRFKNITLTVMGLLGIFATAGTAAAQTTEQNLIPATDSDTTHNIDSIKSPIHVAGRLRDKTSLAAAAYIKIEVLQNGEVIKTTNTDFEGKFNFVLRKEELTDSLITIRVLFGFPEANSTTSDYTVVNSDNLDAAEFDMLITGIPTHHLINTGHVPTKTNKHVYIIGGASSMVTTGKIHIDRISPTSLENQLLQWNNQR